MKEEPFRSSIVFNSSDRTTTCKPYCLSFRVEGVRVLFPDRETRTPKSVKPSERLEAVEEVDELTRRRMNNPFMKAPTIEDYRFTNYFRTKVEEENELKDKAAEEEIDEIIIDEEFEAFLVED